MVTCVEFAGHKAPLISVIWCTKTNRIISTSVDDSLIVWDADSGGKLAELEGNFGTVCCSADGDQIASCGNEEVDDGDDNYSIFVRDISSGGQIAKLNGHTDEVTCLAWCPTANCIASASKDSTAIIWNAVTGDKVAQHHGFANSLMSVAWSPNEFLLLFGCEDGSLIVWNAAGEKKPFLLDVEDGHSDCVRSVAWAPDGRRFASGSIDKMVIVWDATAGRSGATCVVLCVNCVCMWEGWVE